jgi:hypothetical protein
MSHALTTPQTNTATFSGVSSRPLWEDGSMKGANIGFALYTRGEKPGTLDARWSYENTWGGSGQAIGGPERGFAGRYHIRYHFESGEFSDEYDLEIERTGDLYDVTWRVDGEVNAVGVGMEVGEQLAVGWRRVTD